MTVTWERARDLRRAQAYARADEAELRRVAREARRKEAQAKAEAKAEERLRRRDVQRTYTALLAASREASLLAWRNLPR